VTHRCMKAVRYPEISSHEQVHVNLSLEVGTAFDIVDSRLQYPPSADAYTSFGVDGTVLRWFDLFLTGKSQAVAFQGDVGLHLTPLRCPHSGVCHPLTAVYC